MTYKPVTYTITSSDCVLVDNNTTTQVRLKEPFLSFDFTYQSASDIVVKVNGVKTNNYGLVNASTITLGETFNITQLPVVLTISRETTGELTKFFPGASVRAEDLNDNFALLLQRIEELENG